MNVLDGQGVYPNTRGFAFLLRSGTIPTELGKLTALTHLYLYENGLTGECTS